MLDTDKWWKVVERAKTPTYDANTKTQRSPWDGRNFEWSVGLS